MTVVCSEHDVKVQMVQTSLLVLAAFIAAAAAYILDAPPMVVAALVAVGLSGSFYYSFLAHTLGAPLHVAMASLLYPLQAAAALVIARRGYGVVAEECKLLAALSLPLALLTPLAVHVCLKPPLGSYVGRSRPRRL